MSTNISKVDWFTQLMAGGMAGAVSRTAVSPLERAKIIYQVEGRQSSLWTTLKTIFEKEGIPGLLRGNGTNVLRMIPYSAIQFTVFEQLKGMIAVGEIKAMSTRQRLGAGACAGIASVICTYPLDVIRTKLSLQTKTKGIFDCALETYRGGGLRAFYHGALPTVFGIAPYVALNFTVYETCRGMYKDPGVVYKLACGGVAGAVAQTFTYPIDVIRRRMQVDPRSVVGTAKQVYHLHGIRGFYMGLLPNYLKVVPSISVSFVVYEAMVKILHWNGGISCGSSSIRSSRSGSQGNGAFQI